MADETAAEKAINLLKHSRKIKIGRGAQVNINFGSNSDINGNSTTNPSTTDTNANANIGNNKETPAEEGADALKAGIDAVAKNK